MFFAKRWMRRLSFGGTQWVSFHVDTAVNHPVWMALVVGAVLFTGLLMKL